MKKILVVEDDPRLNSNLAELLLAEGYTPNSAGNGIEALKCIDEEIPDLIISDISMPEMNGMELLEKVKSNLRTSSVPFIFLTAKAESYDIRNGMNLGADDYLTKPFKTSVLLDSIAVRLKKREKSIKNKDEVGF